MVVDAIDLAIGDYINSEPIFGEVVSIRNAGGQRVRVHVDEPYMSGITVATLYAGKEISVVNPPLFLREHPYGPEESRPLIR